MQTIDNRQVEQKGNWKGKGGKQEREGEGKGRARGNTTSP